MQNIKHIVLITILVFASAHNVAAITCMGYDLSSEDNKEIIDIIRSAAYIPAILTADSSNSGAIFMGSLVVASATGWRLTQELFCKPQTALWRQLSVNLPLVLLCVGNIVFDVARMAKASSIAEKNKQLPKNDFKLHQGFCLVVEFFLRGTAWTAKNPEKNQNKQLLSRLTLAADIVEQLRLNSRWFRLNSALSRCDLNKVARLLMVDEALEYT